MDLNDAHDIAKTLMTKHGLFDEGWTLKWGHAKSQFGSAKWKRERSYYGIIEVKSITLSKPLTLLNDESEFRNMVLHEIAHALAGPKAGHGPEWKRIARSIGCDAKRLHNADTPEYRYVGSCVNGHIIRRHRIKEATKTLACSRCCNTLNGGKWSRDYLIRWVDTQAAKV
jgi:SprT protein